MFCTKTFLHYTFNIKYNWLLGIIVSCHSTGLSSPWEYWRTLKNNFFVIWKKGLFFSATRTHYGTAKSKQLFYLFYSNLWPLFFLEECGVKKPQYLCWNLWLYDFKSTFPLLSRDICNSVRWRSFSFNSDTYLLGDLEAGPFCDSCAGCLLNRAPGQGDVRGLNLLSAHHEPWHLFFNILKECIILSLYSLFFSAGLGISTQWWWWWWLLWWWWC